jgi:hypothetical protein
MKRPDLYFRLSLVWLFILAAGMMSGLALLLLGKAASVGGLYHSAQKISANIDCVEPTFRPPTSNGTSALRNRASATA